jgi:hypothetical protein
MSAKVTLVGQPQSLTIKDGIVSFRLITGSASNTSPKGLNLFKAATYVVQCSERQYNRGRVDTRDKSELILEGYQEPRVDERGQPYIAVVALSVASKNTQNARKLEQLREETIKAEEAYDQVCEQFGVDSPQAEAAGQTFEGVKAGLLKFMANHPELK